MTPTELFAHAITNGVVLGLVVAIGGLVLTIPLTFFRRAAGL